MNTIETEETITLPKTAAKDGWLRGTKNGTGKDAPTWNTEQAAAMRPENLHGNRTIKAELLANVRRQLGLKPNHSFLAGK